MSAPFRILATILFAVVPAGLSRQPAPATAGASVQTVVVTGGQPDDVTLDSHGRLVWGDLIRGTVNRLVHGKAVVLARRIETPEGIVVLPNGTLIVAAQGLDQIVSIGVHGRRHAILQLRPVAGQEGVDGIGYDPHAHQLLVPDSPRGTVQRVSLNGRRVRQIAYGLGRPVDAALDRHGNVLVPDEHLGTVITVSPRGAISRIGQFLTPDDVAVDAHGTIWVTTLGDNTLWRIKPGGSPVPVLTNLENPQGLTLDRCGNPIVVEQSAGRIVRLVLHRCSHFSLG